MNPEILENFINTDEELFPHKGYLGSITKPSVDISLSNDKAEDFGSRFGGTPLVPKDFVWPTHPQGEYRFLGQINFSEISNGPEQLPKSGLLSLFYAYDEDGEMFWGDDGYVVGYFYKNISDFRLYNKKTYVCKAKKATLSNGVEIPRHQDLRNDWPFDTDALYDLPGLEGYCEDYMLGYPSFYTLAYDPTPSDEWVSLLTLNSYDEFGWCWHDGDKLMIFIEKEKLKNADFSSLKTDAG
ncbi:YwqG family protein [Marinobacter xestospongiae]|uniref:YwqG family protein n=1 Tax=Marinobacter xestospongiae TaxID=994319 RepID=A0ABU3W2Q4_9GAMM|nr:YwqG family protein [Marinobacter xestospongiae]MDV2080701.1 YwqG family protein [Marinobacter xestospongiae]